MCVAGHWVSGARASRPKFDQAIAALHEGDTLVITTLDRLGRSTQNMLAFAETGTAARIGQVNLSPIRATVPKGLCGDPSRSALRSGGVALGTLSASEAARKGIGIGQRDIAANFA